VNKLVTTNYLLAHVELARLYNELGREKEAQAEEAATRRLNPHIALEILRGTGSQKEHKVEPEGILARSSTSLKAYAYVVGGVGYFFRWTQEANIQAQQLWEKASELDPQFAAAHTLLGATYLYAWVFQWSQDPQTLEQALTLARRVLALDDSLSFGHSLLGMVYLLKKQYEQAIVEGERAIALNPNDGDAHGYLGLTLASAGQPEEAVRMVEKGMRLNPRFPASLLSTLGWAYRLTGRSEEARDAVKRALNLNPNYLPAHLYLAVLYSESGLEEGARGEGAEVLRLSPNFSLEVLRQRSFSKDPAEVERIVAALRKAGLK
jgi:adenylate cyclase